MTDTNDINSESRVGLRRYRKNLKTAGQGYILFGFWSVIRLFMMFTMNKETMQEIIDSSASEEISTATVKWITVIMLVIIAVIAIIIHLYIGRGAVKYSAGVSRSRGFLIISRLAAIILVLVFPLYFVGLNGNRITVKMTDIASMFVDATVFFIFVDMQRAAYMIKKLSGQAGGEGSAHAG